MEKDHLTVRYWGTSGSIASPLTPDQVRQKIVASISALARQGKLENLAGHPCLESHVSKQLADFVSFSDQSTYGGNTTCVEVNTPDSLIILDAGTGIRELGSHLENLWNSQGADANRVGHLFLSHLHADHLVGLPFCNALFDARNHFDIYATPEVCKSIETFLNQQSNLGNRLFPPIMGKLKGIRGIHPIHPGESISFGNTLVTAHQLTHPGGSQAYRISTGGKSFAFVTDHEQMNESDPGLIQFIRGANLMYCDGQFLLEEYLGNKGLPDFQKMPRKGWGHTAMEWCIQSAAAAGVEELHLGHKDPFRSDQDLEQIELNFQEQMANQGGKHLRIRMAREGMIHGI